MFVGEGSSRTENLIRSKNAEIKFCSNHNSLMKNIWWFHHVAKNILLWNSRCNFFLLSQWIHKMSEKKQRKTISSTDISQPTSFYSALWKIMSRIMAYNVFSAYVPGRTNSFADLPSRKQRDQNRILDLHFFELYPPIGIELYMEPETTVASLLFIEQDTTKPQSKNPADLFPERHQLCRCQIFWNVCRKFQWNSLTASLDDLTKCMSSTRQQVKIID